MRVRALRKIALCLLALQLIAASGVARACEPADEDAVFQRAEVIFTGRLVEYQFDHFSTGERSAGILTYEVDSVLRGELGSNVRLAWGGAPWGAGIPDSIRSPKTEIVGAYRKPPLSVGRRPLGLPEFTLLTGGCGDRKWVPATQSNIETVQRWIKTGEEGLYEGSPYVEGDTTTILARDIRRIGWLIGGSAVAALIALLIWYRRRRRRPA